MTSKGEGKSRPAAKAQGKEQSPEKPLDEKFSSKSTDRFVFVHKHPSDGRAVGFFCKKGLYPSVSSNHFIISQNEELTDFYSIFVRLKPFFSADLNFTSHFI